MSTELNVIPSSALTEQEQADLNASIDSIIAAHKNDRQEINRLVFESVSAMTDSEGYEQELSSRKGLRRFWGAITGSNKRLQNKINSSRAAAQFAAQTTLQRLSEQNLLTFDLITAVNNKLNASMTAVEGEVNQIYAALIQFFKQSRGDMIQLENRVAKLEQNVNLLNWQNSIEYQMLDGVEYVNLDDASKIVCMVRDFYDITSGEYVAVENVKVLGKVATGELTLREGFEKMQETTASTVAGLGSMKTGAEIGAAVGLAFGPVGAAVGGFVGGTVAYMAGSKVGELAVKGARKVFEAGKTVVKGAARVVSNVVSYATDRVRDFVGSVAGFFGL